MPYTIDGTFKVRRNGRLISSPCKGFKPKLPDADTRRMVNLSLFDCTITPLAVFLPAGLGDCKQLSHHLRNESSQDSADRAGSSTSHFTLAGPPRARLRSPRTKSAPLGPDDILGRDTRMTARDGRSHIRRKGIFRRPNWKMWCSPAKSVRRSQSCDVRSESSLRSAAAASRPPAPIRKPPEWPARRTCHGLHHTGDPPRREDRPVGTDP